MKRMLCILCCVLLLPAFLGCKNNQTEFLEPANFYYLNKDITYNSASGVISPEIRETVDMHGDLTVFLNAYLQGPESSNLEPAIPADVKLVTCAVIDKTVTLTFSEGFANLSGARLSSACTALLLSVHDFTGAESIRVCAKNSLLDEKEDIYLTINDVVLIDTVVQPEE